ncbi:MAG: ABC transporter ATP-binding protein/permease [Oscillospiraceae bacterium]|nr:ABC transporter ATP-binding protein/permease [Oscillospiraceae bacterium]
MLEIKNITKDYVTSSETVHALRDVSVSFRESELVAILGHSGCGKTTLLNIIGGLDQYTSGDLIINGKTTKQFRSRDWDTYRNHSVGFIFQSYNLIPHQTVLANVELALTLSGISKRERRERAALALQKVGLGDQLNKRPNQMSGGQMQRVAIARALVNDPDILLADEPTGALDSETSVQIMDLVKEIAKDRLVIMVTHNPELAEQYATRTIRLVDGKIKSDSDPYDPSVSEPVKEKPAESSKRKTKKTKMSFLTALALSRNNLLTKKGRTFLTAFAGSIGIIGIALILSLSNGVQLYIDSVERSTLAAYPVSIQQETIDYTSLMSSMMGIREETDEDRDPDRVYTNNISTEMMKTMLSEITTNNLAEFKEYIESNPDNILDSVMEIKYSYSPNLYIYGTDINDKIIRVNPSTVMQSMLGEGMASNVAQMSGTYSTLFGGGSGGSMYDAWDELLNSDVSESQYEVLFGRLPESYNEVVVIVNEHNELSDITLYTLGLRDQEELSGLMSSVMAGESFDLDTGDLSFSYEELTSLRFRLLVPSDFYRKNADGGYDDMSKDEEFMRKAYENAPEIKVVGVVRPNGDSLINSSNSGSIGYTHALTEFMIDRANNSELVKLQKENPEIDVFTGIEFPEKDEKPEEPMSQEEAMQAIMGMLSEEQTSQFIRTLAATLTPEQQAQIMQLPVEQQLGALFSMADQTEITKAFMSILTAEQLQQLMELTREPETTEATYDGNLELLGVADLLKPSSISIYAKDFDGKEKITKFITDYNNNKISEDKQEDVINYTDYVGMMISSVSDIIDSISYILIAFVAISLVVSSIMIGIITYISVLERTKEIGILRAMGASKTDVSNVFNAETLIIGFTAGAIGIIVTLLLNIPINIIIEYLTDISNMSQLPWQGGVILVFISMLLTLIAGLFPAGVAAKKDPVEALRTE